MTDTRANPNDLVTFLRARLDDDEATARRGFSHPERWVRVAPTGIPNGLSCSAVLREVEAKRRVLERYLVIKAEVDDREARSLPADALRRDARILNEVIRDLATAYADHPNYREGWRP